MSWSYLLESDNLTREQLRKYNVSELQGILTQLNLGATGKKHELVERLFQFWQSIQTPAPSGKRDEKPSTPCVKFVPPTIHNIVDFRARIEAFGHVAAIVIDPESSECFVAFRSTESAEQLAAAAEELGIRELEFVHENDVEKKARDLELLPEHTQFHNAAQRTFRKTTCEPRLYWCPANSSDEE